MFFLNRVNVLLLSALPLALITGPALPDIIISISSIIFIIITIKEKELKYYKNNYFLFFLLFCIYLVINSLFSKNYLLSLESSLFYIRFGIFSLSIWHCIENNSKFKSYFFNIFFLTYLFLIFDGFYQFYNGVNIFGYAYNNVRLTGPIGEHYVLGSYLARLYPILVAIYLSVYKQNNFGTLSLCIMLILIDVLVFVTGERTSFFYIIFSTILIILLVKRWFLVRLTTFVISTILILLITLNSDRVKNRMVDATLSQMNLDAKSSGSSEFVVFTPDHTSLYLTAYKIFKDNIITGIGPKLFRESCKEVKYFKKDSCSSHPHNTYIQLLSETGVLGFASVFLIFIYLSFYFIKIFFKQFYQLINFKSTFVQQEDDILTLFLIALYISLWPFVPTGNFFNNWLCIIYFLPVGFILQKIHSVKINE